jgi:hypothetical protein
MLTLKKGTAFEELARKHSFDMYKVAGGRVPDPINADPKTDALEREVMERALKLRSAKPAARSDQRLMGVCAGRREESRRAPELADVQDLLLAELRVRKGGRKVKAAERACSSSGRSRRADLPPGYRTSSSCCKRSRRVSVRDWRVCTRIDANGAGWRKR